MMSVQPSSPERQGGFTLIELMTSMLIGVILVAGAITIFDAFGRAVRVQNAVANQADSGRYALERLATEIRMAGYREQAWLRPPLDDAIVVSDGGSAPDIVTVRYEAATDCAGVATVGPDFLATNRFDIVNGNLRCNGEILANGVEDLQVLLGEDLDNDGSTNRFLPPGAAGLDPERVRSLQLYLMLVTPEARVQRTAQTFSFFGNANGNGESTVFDDGRHRLEMAAVLALRNPRDL